MDNAKPEHEHGVYTKRQSFGGILHVFGKLSDVQVESVAGRDSSCFSYSCEPICVENASQNFVSEGDMMIIYDRPCDFCE